MRCLDVIEVLEETGSDVVVVRMSGVVTESDVAAANAQLERRLEEQAALKLYVDLVGLNGFESGVAWKQAKFDLENRAAVPRAAFVVDAANERVVSAVGAWLLGAESREFGLGEEESARRWLAEG